MSKAGVLMGIFISIFSAVCFCTSLQYNYYGKYGPGPGLLPLWVFGLLFILSIALIVDSYRNEPGSIKDILPKGNGLQQVIKVLVAVVLFVIATPFTGYNIASILMFIILFWSAYKWYSNLGISILATAIIFFVFNTILHVPLPVSTIGF